ncbi:MAG: GNAT family N-acetyltransferase [Bacteroidetes bacterium GWF2_40_14]|nr:MAG: GNAT family N-acetyltransferase [Bacteroidetes bacterium GWF2_40_14]
MDEIKIREIEKDEIDKLEDMLYEAVYQPDKNNLIPRDVIKVPKIYAYIDKFGTLNDDYCLVADLNGRIIGAVWVRIITGKIKGYGNVDNKTPEFAISLFKEYRNKGLGTTLMNKMINYLQKKRYEQTSLSVQKENYAVRLYKKLGFEIVDENNEYYIMVLKLN